MQNFEIRRPRSEDQEAINYFFSLVISDTYDKEGLGDRLKDIQDETETKKSFLTSDLSEELCRRHFLIAFDGDKVIGSIEYGSPNEIIRNLPGDPFKGMVEVGSVFVHPLHQGQGIGSKLLQAMIMTLKEHNINEFCLDSGYTKAKQIWQKKFGEPAYVLKDYWGQGFDHFVWHVRISDII